MADPNLPSAQPRVKATADMAAYQRAWRKRNAEKVREASRRWRAANPERAKAKKVAYRAKNIERIRKQDREAKRKERQRIRDDGGETLEIYLTKRREIHRAWIAANADHVKAYRVARWQKEKAEQSDLIRERRRASWQRNKAKAYAATRNWLKKNPDKVRVYIARRRALECGCTTDLGTDDIATLLKKQRGKCAYCRESIRQGYEIDHIIPLSKGGKHTLQNLQLTCRGCNRRKHAKHPADFARIMGLLI